MEVYFRIPNAEHQAGLNPGRQYPIGICVVQTIEIIYVYQNLFVNHSKFVVIRAC